MSASKLPATLRYGSALLAFSSFGLLAAPITIANAIPDLTTRTSRHVFAGVMALITVAILEFLLAVIPLRRGEPWALAAASAAFVVVGIPVLVVDATYVAPERLFNTLAPQVLGLVVGITALILCAFGIKTARR